MDFLNLHTTDKTEIKNIINSQSFTSVKNYDKKDIFRIGKKGVKIIANKSFDKYGNFYGYSMLKTTLKPHYYFNNDLHNSNIITANETIIVLKEIAQKLNIKNLQLHKPTAIDFGINVVPEEHYTKDIVSQTLYFKKKPFLYPYKHLNEYKTTLETGEYATIGMKIYNKGIQYPDYCNENTLRYENVFKTAQKLKTQFKIISFEDLLQENLYQMFSEYLLNSWEHVLILDEINEGIVNHYEDKRHYRNGLSNAKKEYYKTDGKWHKELKNLFEYMLKEKFLKMQIPTLIDNWNLHKTTQTDIVGICTNKINCLITGLDISMQRKGSKYLCFAGLKYYREKEINKYKELENKYLTDKMRLRDWEEQLYYIAHNIRNAKTNLIHNRKSFEQRNYPQNQLQFSFQF